MEAIEDLGDEYMNHIFRSYEDIIMMFELSQVAYSFYYYDIEGYRHCDYRSGQSVNKNKNLEKEIDNIKQTKEIEYKNTLINYSNKEMAISIDIKNKIDNIINVNKINKINIENQSKLLDEEITNLKIKIDKLKELYEKEIDYKKKNKLNEIHNEYKLKLIKYQNEKEKEYERKAANFEIEKKEFDAKKELELNDMKNKALFSQKLMAIFKNIL
jgi:hypothetical protein